MLQITFCIYSEAKSAYCSSPMSDTMRRLGSSTRRLPRSLWVGILLAILWGVYFGFLYPWLMNWGATSTERQMALPGDPPTGGLPYGSHWFTRAVTIHAPAPAVWQWLVQMGQDRAGFYSNTWLENLTGASIHNADVIHPEWQRREIGDHVLLARPDLLGGTFAHMAQTRIVALEPERLIADIPCRFVLESIDEKTTRLLLRESLPSSLAVRVFSSVWWDPIHFVMEQRMLRGIKERAEGEPLVPPAIRLAAHVGWVLAGAGLLVLFLARRRSRPWVVLPFIPALLVVHSTGDWNAALAAFLAIGIPARGALTFGRSWWPSYTLLASAVALILLLAPDAYAAFGITFGVVLMTVLTGCLLRALERRRTKADGLRTLSNSIE
ncbi:MAG: hypothetical protein ABSH52_08535 [Terriglobia bacterium]|jgi:hypothetical protein